MKKAKRNGIISFWKFVFAVVIVLFHTKTYYDNYNIPVFKYGYIACEFFFVVAGFYFAKQVLKEEYDKKTIGKETFQMIGKKFISFFPYILITFLLNMVVKILFVRPNLETIANSIWNLFLIREFGFRSPLVLGQLWFLTAMLVSMFIIYPFLKKHKENFIYIASPLIVLFTLGYLSTMKVGLDFSYVEWALITKAGILRGFAEINIGMIICMINEKLKDIKYTKMFRILITILSHTLLIGVLLITSYINRSPKYDYILLLMISIPVLIMVSEKTVDYDWFATNCNYYLEKISLPMYITHVLFFEIFANVPRLNLLNPIIKSTLVLTCTIVFSIILKLIIDQTKKHEMLKKIKERFILEKKQLIKSEAIK